MTTQAALYHARQRRKSLLNPVHELFRTHVFAHDAALIDTDVFFPNRNTPITFALDVERTDGASNGMLFEFGGASRGCAMAIDGVDLHGAAGGPAVASDGVGLITQNALLGIGNTYRIVMAVHPGEGAVNIWINGQFAIGGQSVNQNLGDGWAGIGDGAVGQVQVETTNRIAAPQQVALSDARIVSPLSVYLNQLPRQFRNISTGSGGSSGSWSNGFDSGFGG